MLLGLAMFVLIPRLSFLALEQGAADGSFTCPSQVIVVICCTCITYGTGCAALKTFTIEEQHNSTEATAGPLIQSSMTQTRTPLLRRMLTPALAVKPTHCPTEPTMEPAPWTSPRRLFRKSRVFPKPDE